MKMAVASDHAGVEFKAEIARFLVSSGHEVIDLGPATGARVDYPDFAARVASAVVRGEVDRGIAICGTGIGMSIAANKVAGIRAALVHDVTSARLAREHNDANVLCLGARLVAPMLACECVAAWLGATYDPRHDPRLAKLSALDGSR